MSIFRTWMNWFVGIGGTDDVAMGTEWNVRMANSRVTVRRNGSSRHDHGVGGQVRMRMIFMPHKIRMVGRFSRVSCRMSVQMAGQVQ